MNLILHHLRKDILAQRWLLVLSILVIALRMIIDLLETQPDYHVASVAEFIRSSQVLPLTGSVLWVVLLARLIQSEPVTGMTSFWLTRPVPRSVYVSSKLLFILLFLVIPYLIPTPLDMLHFGVDPAQLRGSVQSSLGFDAYALIVLLWLATYTRTLSQFWGALIAFILAAVGLIAAAAFSRFNFGNYGSRGTEWMFTRWAVFALIFLSGLLVSLFIQHTRRKAPLGFSVGVTGMVIAVLAGFFCPFRLPITWTLRILVGSSTVSEKSVTINYADDWRNHLAWMRNPNTHEWILTGALAPINPDASRVPVLQGINGTFQSGPGMPDKLSNGITGLLPIEGQFDQVGMIAKDLPGVQISNPPKILGSGSWSLFVLDAATSNRVLGKTGELSLSLFGRMQSLVREAAIPLDGDRMSRQPGEIIHVARLPKVPRSFLMVDGSDKPVLAVWTLGYLPEERFLPPTRYYLLVDSRDQTGTFLQPDRSIAVNNAVSVFTGKDSGSVYLLLSGNEPLEHMVLYIYKMKQGDYFGSTLKALNFKMDPK
jgi:ABC-type transport system involved in multi-copper enzyme maturation permease subunit